jgi:hypothetical protein
MKKNILKFWRSLVFGKSKNKASGTIESRKRGRPLKNVSDLTQKQREILLNPNLTYREKAIELNRSLGWIAKWEKCLRQEVMKETLSGLFTRRSQARSQN